MSVKDFFAKSKKEYNKREAVCVIVSVLLALAVGAYAWFATNGLRSFFGVKKIMQAYTLYLTNSRDQRPLELTTKIPPSVGSKQEFVFKVKSRLNDNEGSNTSTIKYELEMNYTENLPVIYDLYKYNAESGEYVFLKNYDTSITEERQKEAYTDAGYTVYNVNEFNRGEYRRYFDTDGSKYFTMAGSVDQYKIVISWDQNRVNNPSDLTEYNKETDLIYVVVREAKDVEESD